MIKEANRFRIIEQSFVRKRRGGQLFELQKVIIADDNSTTVRYRMRGAKGRTTNVKRDWSYYADIEKKGLISVCVKWREK